MKRKWVLSSHDLSFFFFLFFFSHNQDSAMIDNFCLLMMCFQYHFSLWLFFPIILNDTRYFEAQHRLFLISVRNTCHCSYNGKFELSYTLTGCSLTMTAFLCAAVWYWKQLIVLNWSSCQERAKITKLVMWFHINEHVLTTTFLGITQIY